MKLRVKLHTLTPIHIGTGEVYEPLSFFVNPDENMLFEVDFEKICSLIAKSEKGKKEFLEYAQSGSLEGLIKLYKFFDKICNGLYKKGVKGFLKRGVRVFPDFVEHYFELINIFNKNSKGLSKKELIDKFKKFEIYKTAFLLNNEEAYIPGSSLKGSIRTAILNFKKDRVKNKSVEDYKEIRRGRPFFKAKNLEQDILGYKKITQDPFKFLKVSDLKPAGAWSTKIVYAVNRKKDGKRASGPFQIFEVIEEGSVFEGTISIEQDFSKMRTPFSEGEIIKALNSFYIKEFEKERKILEKFGLKITKPSKGVLIRIGKHSGAECVTIKGFRSIQVRTRGGRVKNLPYSTTLWLASEDRKGKKLIDPFGWAVLEFSKF